MFLFQTDDKDVKNLMAGLDVNKDNELNFQEFVTIIASLTIVCNDFFKDFDKGTRE